MDNYEQHITEFAYSLFPLASIVLVGFIIKLIYTSISNKDHLSVNAYRTLAALMLVGIAAGERVGWFALSRVLGPKSGTDLNGCTFMVHNEFMWSVKWAMGLQTGLMYVAGVMLFIHTYQAYTAFRLISTLIFIFGLALVSAIF